MSVEGITRPNSVGNADLAAFLIATGLIAIHVVSDNFLQPEPGTSAALLVYENVWAAPFATAVRKSGGQLVAQGRIPVQAILAALDAAEAK